MSNNFLRWRDPWKAVCTGDSRESPERSYVRVLAPLRAYRYARASIVRRPAQSGWSLLTFWKFRNRNGSSRRAFDAIRYRRPTARRRFHRWPLERFLMLFRKNNLMLRWKDPNLNHFSFFEIINRQMCKPNDEKNQTRNSVENYYFHVTISIFIYNTSTILRILNLILFIFYHYDRQFYYPKLNFNLMKKATFRFSVKQLTLTT